MKKFLSLLLIGVLIIGSLTACSGDESAKGGHIVFADAVWECSSPVNHEGVLNEEIDAHMDEWLNEEDAQVIRDYLN